MARDTHSLLRASHESHKCESSVSVEKRKEGREGGKEEGVVLRKPAPEPLGFYSLMGTLCSLFSDQGLVTQPRKVVFVGSWRGANLCEGGGIFFRVNQMSQQVVNFVRLNPLLQLSK